MAKDPAFLFYSSDFLTGTYTMTNEQVGKYVRLLCIQHQKGTLTEEDMLFICNSYDKDIYNKFIRQGDEFFNERMRIEMLKRKEYSDSRRKNRLNKTESTTSLNKEDNTTNQDMKNICQTYVRHMENENENINTSSSLVLSSSTELLNELTNNYTLIETLSKNYFKEPDAVKESMARFCKALQEADEYPIKYDVAKRRFRGFFLKQNETIKQQGGKPLVKVARREK